jgi:C4-type Zn-finger protein
MSAEIEAVTSILEIVGMEDLAVDVATAGADAEDEDTGISLASGCWTAGELAKLEGIAERMKANPTMATAAEQLLSRVHDARKQTA